MQRSGFLSSFLEFLVDGTKCGLLVGMVNIQTLDINRDQCF